MESGACFPFDLRLEPCLGDGMLGRRRMLAVAGVAVAGERWIEGRREWWLDARFLDSEWAPIAYQAELPDGPDDLSGPLPPAPGRAATLAAAVEETRTYVRRLVNGIAAELPWAQPGTPDYEREFDRIAEAKAAFVTLEALCAERRTLMSRASPA